MKIEMINNPGVEPMIDRGTVRLGKGTSLEQVESSGPVSFGDNCLVRRTQIGRYSATGSYCQISDCNIGSFCSLGDNIILNAGKHPKGWLTTHLFATNPNFWNWADEYRNAPGSALSYTWRERATIGNDVWIGNNVVILTGVTIGDGAIIGANTVVTRDIPPYSVAVGAPAAVKSKRFDDNTIERITRSQWWNLSMDLLLQLPINDVQETLQILENQQLSKTANQSN